jgi:hypothetical protein
MTPDNFQEAWQSQSSQTRVTIAADLLLKEVQRNQEDFQATIMGRDIREVGVSLLMIPLWFFLGAMWSLPWSWYLTVPALIWIAGFILFDRIRQCRQSIATGEPLVESVRESLTQVDHQIWLLKNIVWWYLLPPTISLLAFFAHATWKTSRDWSGSIPPMLIVVSVYAFVYYVNQLTVRTQLEPRREELLTLLAGLKDETSGADAAPILERTHDMKSSKCMKTTGTLWGILSFIAVLAAVITAASFAAHYAGRGWSDYPKLSPFTAVRWDGEQPEAELNGQWFKLVSINDVSTDEMLAFSKKSFGRKWRKRFEEDLVELLTLMGHKPADTVTLVVQSLTGPQLQTLENVLMTEENRWAIRDAAEAREDKADQ